jgi:hypothetical protein
MTGVFVRGIIASLLILVTSSLVKNIETEGVKHAMLRGILAG